MPTDAPPARDASASGTALEADGWRAFSDNIGFVSRTLRHLGVPDPDLEDICQEVFLVAHKRRGSFEGRSSIRTWLYRICWNTAANHRRTLARAGARQEPLSAEPAVDAPQEATLQRQRARRQLAQLLERLDDDRRAVFVLYEIEQLSMREVADVVGCPLQTAYSRLKAAHKVVREAAATLSHEREGRDD